MENDHQMGTVKLIAVLIFFICFYKYVTPLLFPTVVAKKHRVDLTAKNIVQGATSEIVVKEVNLPFVQCSHRLHTKAELRRRRAESTKSVSYVSLTKT